MSYLGIFRVDDYLGIPAATHRFSSGAAYAPTVLTYSIYEEATAVGLDEDVDMTPASPFDAITGCYWVRRQLTAAAGFEAGKNYLVVVKATVDSVAAIQMHTFQVEAVNVAQTGDAYARLGAAGAGLTALGDTRLANLDATVSSRSTYAGGAVASVTGAVGSVTGAVGSVAAGGITAASFAADAITAAKLAADVTTELQTGLATAAELAKVPKSDGTATWNATALTTLQTKATDALNAYDPPTNAEMVARTLLAADYTVVSDLPVPPTAIENADALLKRDWTAVTGEAARSVFNALRFLRNKWSISGTTLTVTKEDDSTTAWTGALTASASADPITALDPN